MYMYRQALELYTGIFEVISHIWFGLKIGIWCHLSPTSSNTARHHTLSEESSHRSTTEVHNK